MTTHIGKAMLLAAINAMPVEFDSHDLIVYLMRHYPREYVMHLYSRIKQTDPIRQGNADIGKRLARLNQIRKTNRPSSGNIRSGVTENQGWRKT
ncbi:MAG: hypothetical protein ACYC8T_31035 [Myxococcaceae bacterium]